MEITYNKESGSQGASLTVDLDMVTGGIVKGKVTNLDGVGNIQWALIIIRDNTGNIVTTDSTFSGGFCTTPNVLKILWYNQMKRAAFR